ncbi:NAD-dependent epimerase/dehydratase family protein [Streptomyces sp. NPDC006458]|uniref:NAD-dependent epimerase/dehydratase family protein n=1 Tax=Streptomyces sp. NPDC006458 TaxID=3154302 RepID=UPI0033BA4820
MRRAVVIGATGQIGRPAVAALARDGWEVTAASRGGTRDETWPEGVRAVRLDREDDRALEAVIGEGCDVLVDMVAFREHHARQVTRLAGRVGSAVVISSVAVYEEGRGRGFDTQSETDGFPHYPLPIPETQATVSPGDTTYSTRKAAVERELLAAGDRLPATLLRSGAVHGPHCRTPRELYFVKRNLDGRRSRVLAYGGESRFHPVSVHTLAELIRLAAARPGSRVLNACDDEAPTVAEIAGAIDTAMGVAPPRTVLVEGPPPAPTVGDSPWSVPAPVVCDMSAARRELDYRPVTRYAESLPETVEWITAQLSGRDWREAYPKMYANYGDLFDYAAEEEWTP